MIRFMHRFDNKEVMVALTEKLLETDPDFADLAQQILHEGEKKNYFHLEVNNEGEYITLVLESKDDGNVETGE